MPLLSTVAGVVLVLVALNDVFHTLLRRELARALRGQYPHLGGESSDEVFGSAAQGHGHPFTLAGIEAEEAPEDPPGP